MMVTQTLYSDPQKLNDACRGNAVNACVYTDTKTYCNMHLPAAANGEAIAKYRWHELNHCAGGIDSPVAVR
jgi:hypothetical protein